MTELIEGIITAFNADDSLLALLPRGVFQELAPTGDALEYLILTLMPSGETPVFGDFPSMTQARVQFSIWTSKGGAQAATILKILADKFNTPTIDLPAGAITNAWLSLTPRVRPQRRKDQAANSTCMGLFEVCYSLEMAGVA